MKFIVGDKVTFLNEKLEGIVTAVLGGGIVKVAIENDFEIDVLENEIAKIIMNAKPMESIFVNESKPIVSTTQSENIHQSLAIKNSLVAAFIPAQGESNNNGKVDFILINALPHSATAVVSLLHQGTAINNRLITVESQNTHVCISLTRHEWQLQMAVQVDALLFVEGKAAIKPLSRQLAITMPGRDVVNHALPGRAAFARKVSLYEWKPYHIDASTLEKMINARTVQLKDKPQAFIIEQEIVFDLHLDSVDMTAYTNHAESPLEQQLNAFRQQLNGAVFGNNRAIVFVHGVGDGVLKNALLRELSHYKAFTVVAAPQHLYGNGAIKVTLV